jgi:hypothetical protein
MFDRYKLDEKNVPEDNEEYKALKKRFGMLHGISSLANLAAFCAGAAHSFFLASGLTE